MNASCTAHWAYLHLVCRNRSGMCRKHRLAILSCCRPARYREAIGSSNRTQVPRQALDVAGGNAVTKIMSPEEFEQELRAIGAERYHDKHPFHKLLHGGMLNKGQVQAWALNRYCYQSAVPRKD